MGRAEQGSGIPKPCAEPASSQNNGTKGSAAMPVGTMKNGLSIAKQSIAASKVRRMSSLGARCMSYLLARRRFALVVGLFAGLAIPWAGHNLGIWDTELPLQGNGVRLLPFPCAEGPAPLSPGRVRQEVKERVRSS
eukprot:135563-Hanusia_phi.AAC.7